LVPSHARIASVYRARALVAWLAMASLLAGGFMPAVSTALAAAAMADLCIGAMPGAPRDGSPADGRVHAADCAYCLPHGGTDALPPPGLFGRVPSAEPEGRASLSAAAAPPAARPWSPSVARAPPAPSA